MRRDLILIALAMFTWGLGEGLFLSFQPIYLEQLGAAPIQIGAILGGFGLAMTVSHLPAGYLADRIGRKPLLVAAWIFGMVATWIMALANSLPIFVMGVLLYGTTMFVMAPLYSYLAAARGRLSVGRVITLISACFNSGAVIGPWLGGQIGDRAGLRQAYFFAGILFVASTLVMLFIRSQPVERAVAVKERTSWFFSPRYLAYLGAYFLAIFATFLSQPLTPNFLSNQRDLTLGQVGTLYSVASIGVVVLSLILGAMPARRGFLLGQAAVACFALVLWLGVGPLWYLLGFFLLGGYKTARSLGSAQMRELAPQEKIGLAFGISETLGGIAVILAPLLAGYLYARNPIWVYPLAAGLILASLLVSARFSPTPAIHEIKPTETDVQAPVAAPE
jgi:MFS family permease